MGKLNIKERITNFTEDKRIQAEGMAVNEFYNKVMKEDGLTWEETLEICRTEPKYSLGVKLQIYMIDATICPTKANYYRDQMIATLTPEELEIYEKEVVPMNMKKMVKDAMKERMKGMKG